MTGPVRILHVLGTLDMGGAESRIMDIYRHIDRDRVQFDFLVHTAAAGADTSSEALMAGRKPQFYDAEVTGLGGRIYSLPRFTGTNLGVYRKACRAFFAAHHDFAAAEGHMTSMASVYLREAKRCGVPVTIAHARSAGVDSGIRGAATRALRLFLPSACDLLFTCSAPAAVSVYGRRAGEAILVPNALEVRRFLFDEEKRREMRTELGLAENSLAVGHVGRFDAMKNQAFLAQTAPMVQDALPGRETVYVFIGEGKCMDPVREAFAAAGIRAVFAGRCGRERTIALYQAFDAFAFPSLYEGLPGTVIEAQAAGLPCVIADTITDEVCLTPLVRRVGLAADTFGEALTESLREVPEETSVRRARSEEAIALLGSAGYDAEVLAEKLACFYTSLKEKPCAESADILRNSR